LPLFALLLQDQGDRAAARPLFERALAIREKVFGPEHRDSAKSRENLARVIKDQSDLAATRSTLRAEADVPSRESPRS
jgi:Tetratricopeptide repeat